MTRKICPASVLCSCLSTLQRNRHWIEITHCITSLSTTTHSLLSLKVAELPEPSFSFLYLLFNYILFLFFFPSVDDVQCSLSLRRGGEVLVSILSDQNIVFNSYSTNRIVLFKDWPIDVFGDVGVSAEEFKGITREVAEVVSKNSVIEDVSEKEGIKELTCQARQL